LYRDQKTRPITHDISNYSDLSVSADGRMVAAVLSEGHSDVFIAPATDLSSAKFQQLTSGAHVYSFGWTPDGQMLLEQEVVNLFHPDTGTKTPLTSLQDGGAFLPVSCANGRYVVMSIAGHGGATTVNIWRMDAGGGNLKQLSDGKRDERVVCSPDGKWVYYSDLSSGAKLTRVSLEGGKPERLSELPAYYFDLSPDGRVAAFATFAAPGTPKQQLALVPVDSPKDTKLLELQRLIQGNPRFTRDGKAVVYPIRDQDADNLWLQPLDGSPGKQITDFKSEHIWDFHWSFDGSKLAVIRGHTDSDVVLLEESKP
jgi:eukaryotic-like serine/threonine-protein kinase